MPIYLAAFLIGVIAGLRSMTAPAAVSWAARLGALHVEGSWLAWLAAAATSYIFTLAAIGELIARPVPEDAEPESAAGIHHSRILVGALCGAAFGVHGGAMTGVCSQALSAPIAGTLGGYEARVRLVRATGGKDLPIALLEVWLPVGGAILIVSTAL